MDNSWWQFYASWFKEATHGPVGWFQLSSAFAGALSGLTQYYFPEWTEMIGYWIWLVPCFVFIFLLLFGGVRAPYKMHAKCQDERKKDLESRLEQTLHQTKGDTAAAVREEIRKAIDSGYSAEWRTNTRNILKGALGSRYVKEFDGSLWGTHPEADAKAYLQGLVSRVDGSFLKSSRRERQAESHRLNSALDMIRDLIEKEPELIGRFTATVRGNVIGWRDTCITTLRELLSNEYSAASEKMLTVLGAIETQSRDEVRSAAKESVLYLRTIYSQLDEAMLSNSFHLVLKQANNDG